MFGSIVRRARLSRGMSQAQLASNSGVAQSNISAIEGGRREPSASTLHQLLTACGYQLIAEGGDQSIAIPVVPEDADLGDFGLGDMRPAKTAAGRNRQLMAALEMTDAILDAKRRS